MNKHVSATARTGALALLFLASAGPAAAYVGPGVGLGVIGAVLGTIAGVFMVVLGLIWYPVKVALRKRREKKLAAAPQAAAPAAEPAEMSKPAAE